MINWQLFSAKDFALYRQAWDNLNQQGVKTPVLDSRFVEALLNHFATGSELLAIGGPLDNPVAMAIITPSRYGVWSTFQPGQAPIGLWQATKERELKELLSSLSAKLPGWCCLSGSPSKIP